MPDEPLLTVRELADQLSLPESTVRYYRDAFLDHVPAVGTGRRRRYPPAALAVLRSVAEGYAAGLTRAAILRRLDGGDAHPTARQARPGRSRYDAGIEEEITNLDLLAAIVDGEREQREALWQMAREVVRLTQVLETQESSLVAIGARAGLALGAGEIPALPAPDRASAEPPAAAPRPGHARWPWPTDLAPARATAPAEHDDARVAAHPADPSELERLRQELEAERLLVERLREARLRLEQRAVEAEGAAGQRRAGWRNSVLGRLLGTDGTGP
jgi:DNA-binding transcriptional MerR regulator